MRPIIEKNCSETTEDCFGSELAVVSTFTTGNSADTTPPEFSGSPLVSATIHKVVPLPRLATHKANYTAVAVDSAGNETASAPLILPAFDCEEIDKSNPNFSEDPPETPAEDDRSSCAAGGRTSGIGALLLLFVLLRRRRKEQRA